MKVLSSGFNTFNETGKYTLATVEYTGLFSYSILKKGGRAANAGISMVTRPVVAAATWPFGFIKDRTYGIFRSKEHEEMIRGLTEKLAQVEKRLAEIEKYGVAAAGVAPRKRKEVSDDKKFFLKGILEETKSLKEME